MFSVFKAITLQGNQLPPKSGSAHKTSSVAITWTVMCVGPWMRWSQIIETYMSKPGHQTPLLLDINIAYIQYSAVSLKLNFFDIKTNIQETQYQPANISFTMFYS